MVLYTKNDRGRYNTATTKEIFQTFLELLPKKLAIKVSLTIMEDAPELKDKMATPSELP